MRVQNLYKLIISYSNFCVKICKRQKISLNSSFYLFVFRFLHGAQWLKSTKNRSPYQHTEKTHIRKSEKPFRKKSENQDVALIFQNLEIIFQITRLFSFQNKKTRRFVEFRQNGASFFDKYTFLTNYFFAGFLKSFTKMFFLIFCVIFCLFIRKYCFGTYLNFSDSATASLSQSSLNS